MTKLKTEKLTDSLVEYTIPGTNWTIQEWIDNKDKLFTVYNSFTDINDLFYVDMPEQYKTIDHAFDAINEFLENENFFNMEIERSRELIFNYQQANLTYTK